MQFSAFWQAVLNNEDKDEWWHRFDTPVSANDYTIVRQYSQWSPASLKIVLVDRVNWRLGKINKYPF